MCTDGRDQGTAGRLQWEGPGGGRSEGNGQGGEPARGECRGKEEEEDLLQILEGHLERYEEETLGHRGEQILQPGHHDRDSYQHYQHGNRAS